MKNNNQSKGKKINPDMTAIENVMGGNPCLYKSRIPVALLWQHKQSGYTVEEITHELWPHLKGREEEIKKCLGIVKFFKDL